jgi:two-component system OmpR family response regulator
MDQMARVPLPVRVLIVDDDPSALDLLRDVLTTARFEVQTVLTAVDTVAVALSMRPDVILLDLVMPGMDGNQILNALRAHGIRAPAIAVTARPAMAGPGFFDVLGKPLDLERVVSLVADVVRFGRDLL